MKNTMLVLSVLLFICFSSNAQTEYKKKSKTKIEGTYAAPGAVSATSESAHNAWSETRYGTVHNRTYTTSATRAHVRAHRTHHRTHYRSYRTRHLRRHYRAHYKKAKVVHKHHKIKEKFKV